MQVGGIMRTSFALIGCDATIQQAARLCPGPIFAA
jgi:hypothetical protein